MHQQQVVTNQTQRYVWSAKQQLAAWEIRAAPIGRPLSAVDSTGFFNSVLQDSVNVSAGGQQLKRALRLRAVGDYVPARTR
jgi:hypothetical protein